MSPQEIRALQEIASTIRNMEQLAAAVPAITTEATATADAAKVALQALAASL